jgi:hypothetical protein
MISCCTETPISQLYVRFPHPLMRSGSTDLVKTSFPKLWLSIAPHSPLAPVARRSQLGTKSPLASFQVRVVLSGVRMSGFKSRSLLLAVSAVTYLPTFTLTAVLPLPKRS